MRPIPCNLTLISHMLGQPCALRCATPWLLPCLAKYHLTNAPDLSQRKNYEVGALQGGGLCRSEELHQLLKIHGALICLDREKNRDHGKLGGFSN